MFGIGGSALISKTMGEGDKDRPNKIFSLIVYVSIAFGILITFVGFVFIKSIVIALGATNELLEDSIIYRRIAILFLPAFILQFEFQSFFQQEENQDCVFI